MKKQWLRKAGIVTVSSCILGTLFPMNVISVSARETLLANEKASEMTVEMQTTYAEVRDYWRTELLGSYDMSAMDADLQGLIDGLDEKAQNYLDTMQDIHTENEIWNDQLFMEAAKGARVTEALDRLKLMTIQTMQPGSRLYQNSDAKKKIIEALDFIVKSKYGPATTPFGGNWWDQDIGAPKSLVDTAILLYDDLDEAQIANVTKTIDRFIPVADRRGMSGTGMKETGANLVDKVAIVIKRASLDDNSERMLHAKNCMNPLFTYVTKNDGFYTDGSFIQHNTIPYNGSYGYVLLNEMTNCIIMLGLTEQAIDEEDIQFFDKVLVENYLPFISYGGNVVDHVRGRAVSRYVQQGDTMGMNMMGVLLQYAEVANEEIREKLLNSLKGIIDEKFAEEQTQDFSMLAYADYLRVTDVKKAENISNIQKRNSYQVFSNMDRMVAHRDGYSFTLSPSSSRMENTEVGNNENLQGYYQGQGYYQIYNDDISAYSDHYYATVDPYRLAGVTTGHQKLGMGLQGQSPWSGGASLDGVTGSAGVIITGNKKLTKGGGSFDPALSDTESGISANKSYFILGDSVICIGSDINNRNTDTSVETIETIIDNRKVSQVSDSTLLVDGVEKIASTGSEEVKAPKYAYLNGKTSATGTGYVFLEDSNVLVKRETRAGAWSDVNKLAKFTNTEDRENSYVSLAVEHGKDVKNGSYQYVLLPNATQEETASYKVEDNLEIISAGNAVHAIRDKQTGQTMMNFYQAGSVDNVTTTQPASIIMKQDSEGIQLAVADPTHKLTSVDITISGMATTHQDVTSGDASIIATTDNSMTIRVNFAKQDGQSVPVTIATSYDIAGDNLALQKAVKASSVVQNSATADRVPEKAVDGNTTTFWASNYERSDKVISTEEADKGWLLVDLGEKTAFNQMTIKWDLANGYEYKIYAADHEEALAETENGICDIDAGCQEVTHFIADIEEKAKRSDVLYFDEVNARYVKMQGIKRPKMADGTGYGGYCIQELEIYKELSLSKLMVEARGLLEEYPKEAFATQDSFAALKAELEAAITQGEALMKQGAGYQDEELTLAVTRLSNAVAAYHAGILHVTSISIKDGASIDLLKGQTHSLEAILNPVNAYIKEVEWVSSNPKVVKVDENGILHAVAAGDATIRVIAKDNGKSAAIQVHVDIKPTSITLNETQAQLVRGDSLQLTAEIAPLDAPDKTVTWSSSDDKIAHVDGNGMVHAVGVGSATIKAITSNGLFAECTIEVSVNLDTISPNFALNGTATASSVVDNKDTLQPKYAIDGDLTTRWASNYRPPLTEAEGNDQWFLVELPTAQVINQVQLTWFSETVYGKEYKILTSLDGVNYEEALHVRDGANKTVSFSFEPVEAKFVKFQGIERSLPTGGYGIVEFELYHTYNYDEIMKPAKAELALYPAELTMQKEAYTALKDAVDAAEALLEQNPNFDNDEMYQLLQRVEEAYRVYHVFIHPVTGIQAGAPISLLKGESAQVTYTITPEQATNKSVSFTSSNTDVAVIDTDGVVTAKKSGNTDICITTTDGSYTAIVPVSVRTNEVPVINASDITLLVDSAFDPLAYAEAVDYEDGVIVLTDANIIKNTVDVTTAGVYEVIYEVSDRDGNITSKAIQVTIREPQWIQQELNEGSISIQGKLPEGSQLSISDYTQQEEVKAEYTKQFSSNMTLKGLYDISLYNHLEVEIQPNGKIYIRIAVEDVTEINKVLHFKDDKTYEEVTYHIEGNQIVLEVQSLSMFALVFQEESITDDPKDNEEIKDPEENGEAITPPAIDTKTDTNEGNKGITQEGPNTGIEQNSSGWLVLLLSAIGIAWSAKKVKEVSYNKE